MPGDLSARRAAMIGGMMGRPATFSASAPPPPRLTDYASAGQGMYNLGDTLSKRFGNSGMMRSGANISPTAAMPPAHGFDMGGGMMAGGSGSDALAGGAAADLMGAGALGAGTAGTSAAEIPAVAAGTETATAALPAMAGF